MKDIHARILHVMDQVLDNENILLIFSSLLIVITSDIIIGTNITYIFGRFKFISEPA